VQAVNKSLKKSQKGAAIVETALVLITMVSMIFFVLDMGRMLLTQQFIAERARVTARMAAVNNWSATAVANYLCYNTTTSPAPVNGAPPGGYLGLVPSKVAYSTVGTSGTADYRLKVTVSGVRVLTWIPFMPNNFTAAPVTATAPAQSLGGTT
jgi:Flp pilus assembly protein TadG